MGKGENPASDWQEYTGPERRSESRLFWEQHGRMLKDGDGVDFMEGAPTVEQGIKGRLVSLLEGEQDGKKEVFSGNAHGVLEAEAGNIIIRDGVMTVHTNANDVFGTPLMARGTDRKWQAAPVKPGNRIVVRKGPFVTLPEVAEDVRSVLSRAEAGNLKFEFTPARTMAVASFENGAWTNAEYVPTGNMEIGPLADRYGQAFFGGNRALRMKNGKVALFRPDFHANRFNDNARALCMPGVGSEGRLLGEHEHFDDWPQVPPDELIEIYKMVARANEDYVPKTGQGSLYLAPGMRATRNQLGVKPNIQYALTCLGVPAGKIFGKPAELWIEEVFHRAAVHGIGSKKASGNYAPTFRAKHQAHLLGCDDVIYLDNQNQEFRELSSSNLFFITHDGVLVTPDLSGEILNGCTRDSILTIAQELVEQGILTGIEERKVSPTETGTFKEAFSSGTGVTINAIETFCIDGGQGEREDVFHMDISAGQMGPKTRAIYEKFNQILAGEEMDNPRYKDWMVEIDE